jgi:hypothetical protein
MSKAIYGITIRSAFLVAGRWTWVRFSFAGGNKHAAIIAKANELGATAWDFGNAEVSDVHRIG